MTDIFSLRGLKTCLLCLLFTPTYASNHSHIYAHWGTYTHALAWVCAHKHTHSHTLTHIYIVHSVMSQSRLLCTQKMLMAIFCDQAIQKKSMTGANGPLTEPQTDLNFTEVKPSVRPDSRTFVSNLLFQRRYLMHRDQHPRTSNQITYIQSWKSSFEKVICYILLNTSRRLMGFSMADANTDI